MRTAIDRNCKYPENTGEMDWSRWMKDVESLSLALKQWQSVSQPTCPGVGDSPALRVDLLLIFSD